MAFKIGRDLIGMVSFRHEVELVLERLHELPYDLLRVIGSQLRAMPIRIVTWPKSTAA